MKWLPALYGVTVAAVLGFVAGRTTSPTDAPDVDVPVTPPPSRARRNEATRTHAHSPGAPEASGAAIGDPAREAPDADYGTERADAQREDGPQVTYHENGAVRSRGIVRSGLREGEWVWFHRDGKESARGTFLAGKSEGEWSYRERDGRTSRAMYRAGKRQGARLGWYPGGAQEFIEDYVDDELHGAQTRWHPNGALLESWEYRHGEPLDGLQRTYHPNGQVAVERSLAGGELDGVFRQFRENGSLSIEGSFVAGLRDGTWTYFTDGGAISRVETWGKGSMDVPERAASDR